MPNPEIQPEQAHPSYVVVARRYRPQGFAELIGQEHVAQALSNAIATHRVGHAYLFTGARGTGKTSTARIFAKALNCVNGPTAAPCNECDSCQSISGGDDVDVLEIDGASNNGIDEIRELRQNAGVCPSRSRYKIYIIDEVHMLSTQAFNGLLKTLEEPPEHVKFMFCTTETRKIPITILSRCQRFDFAGISTRAIHDRLRQIVDAEGVTAEDEALEVIARRAAGSMRDSQSLLEQLLSFASQKITVADVHGMLGTAGDHRLSAVVKHIVERNPAAALGELDVAAREGVDVAQLIEQLFGYFRDCMVAAVGCSPDAFLYASTTNSAEVVEAGRRLGLQTILAAMQILDQTLSRLRISTQARILAELALVRICNLEDLEELAGLIVQLRSGQSLSVAAVPRMAAPASPANRAVAAPPHIPPAPAAPEAAKKKFEPSAEPVKPTVVRAAASEPAGTECDEDDDAIPASFVLDARNVEETWQRAIENISGMAANQAKQCSRLEVSGINRLTVWFAADHAIHRASCQRPEQAARFEQALKAVTGQSIRIDFKLMEAASQPVDAAPQRPAVSAHQRLMEAAKHPLVQRAGELFGAEPASVEES